MSLFAILALVVAGTTASAAPPVNDVVSNPAKVVSKTAKNEIISIAPKVQLADDSDGRELAQPAYLMDSGELYVPTGAAPAPFLPAPRGPFSITTPPNFGNNNAGSPGGGAYFDLTVGTADIIITGMDVNTSAVAGTPIDISVYTHNLGAINVVPWVCPSPGNPECVPLNWTLVASGTGVSAGPGFPSAMTFAASFPLLANTKTGIAISLSGGVNAPAGHAYTNGTGANQTIGDAFLTLDLGTASNALFACATFCPRVWNGTIHYTPTGIGGCCNAGVCTAPVDVVACVTGGGVFLGSGSTCTPANICNLGACCMNDGSCTEPVDPAACAAAGGTFAGPVTTCATAACPQPGLVQIPAMTIPNTELDWDQMPNGSTTVAAINAQFGTTIQDITLTTTTTALGLYSTNIRGKALGADPASQGQPTPLPLWIVDAVANAPFAAIDAAIFELAVPTTEFGFSIGDWNGPVNANVSLGGVPVATAAFDATGGLDIFFELFGGGTFDTVELTLSPQFPLGNWLMPSIFVPESNDPGNCCDAFGVCTVLTPVNCLAGGGAWSPGDCTGPPCPQPGACCNSNGTGCEDNVLQANCAGDRWEEGVTCLLMSPPCAEDLGACCLTSGCQEGVTGNACFGMGGVWLSGVCAGVLCEDSCATPRTLVDGVISNFDTTGATTDGPGPNENSCTAPANTFIGTNDIWFRYSPPFDGSLTVTLCGSSYDSTLQVYSTIDPGTGSPAPMTCADLPPNVNTTEVCDDDGCGVGGGPSIVAGINALAGQEYLIRVGGWGGPGGNPTGPGTILASVFAINTGACCRLDGTCTIEPAANCLFPEAYFEQQPCGVATCGEIGACCSNVGCNVTFANTCAFLGGTFLGVGSDCGPGGPGNPLGCAGGINGTSDFCAIASGLVDDCDGDGVPDNCTIVLCPPGDPSCSDCDFNGKLDRCDIRCCVSDLTLNASVQGPDIQQIVDGIVNPPTPACWDATLCGLDANKDGAIDTGDIPDHVANLLDGRCEGTLIVHTSTRGLVALGNQVFILDETGASSGQYDQVGTAFGDAWGYRDGASDGTSLFFGWAGGVARHDPDGTNGALFMANTSGHTTIRALAYDPSGNGGAGSLWTIDFGSSLTELSMAGVILNNYPNLDVWSIYGLAYDDTDGNLWAHHSDACAPPPANCASAVWKIDITDGSPNVGRTICNPCWESFFTDPTAVQGGLSMDDSRQELFGVNQSAPDTLWQADLTGTLTGVLSANPLDLDALTGENGNLGVAVIRQ